jgi:cell division protein FtsN
MKAEEHEAEAGRELRLEGFGLLVVGAVLLALVVGVFYLGRWVERQGVEPARLAQGQSASDPLREVAPASVDVSQTANYFDKVDGEQKALEPARQTRSPEPAADAPPLVAEPARDVPVQPPDPVAAPGGVYQIQVFAGRDRASAEAMLRRVQSAGYPVNLLSEAEGTSTLYRVRVGGYPTEEAARQAANRLAAEGHSTWVLRGD